MSELAERLRWDQRYTNGHVPVTMEEAARALEAQAKRIAELEAENERAFQMLSAYGVPKERAKTVANGIDVLMMRMEKADHSANTVGGPTPVMDAAPACEQTAWADQLITKDTAHQIAFAVKSEAEERIPHHAGTFEGLRLQGAMDACDEIMELIEVARVANHQATFQSGHECVSRVSNSDSQMNKQDDARNAGESDS